jgi:hypothetical protein
MSRNRKAVRAERHEPTDTSSHGHSSDPDAGATHPNAHANQGSHSGPHADPIRPANQGSHSDPHADPIRPANQGNQYTNVDSKARKSDGSHGDYRTYNHPPAPYPHASRRAIIYRHVARPT